MAKIFISHSSDDKECATTLAEDLEALGHIPWLDEWEIKVGECIPSRIEHGISESAFVVVILSPHSVESDWVDREWKSKYWDEIQEKETLVLPALLRDCEIPQLLKTKKYADFRENYAKGFGELTSAITPTIRRAQEAVDLDRSPYGSDVTALVARLQSRTAPVSQVMAEALSLARTAGSESLEQFCRNELAGWSQEELNKVSGPGPFYRVVEAFSSVSAEVTS